MRSIGEIDDSTVLFGMMGSGKSKQGRLLAGALRQLFVDTDDLIEERTSKTCRQLIDEGTFVAVQNEVILDFVPEEPMVIATGGSVANYEELVTHLRQFGTSVHLKVEADVLRGRLSDERIAALNNPDGLSFEELWASRQPNYERAADFTLDIGDQSIGDTHRQLLIARLQFEPATIRA